MARAGYGARLFDRSRLSGMSQLLDYEDDVFGEVTTVFCDAASARLAQAGRAAARGDDRMLAQTAHDLVDSASLIGAERMARVAAELEAAVLGGRLDRAPALVASLDEAFRATRAALKHIGKGRHES